MNNSLIYRGDDNFNDSDTITITVDDQANTGFGGILSDTETINVTINAVNDTPEITTVPGAQSVDGVASVRALSASFPRARSMRVSNRTGCNLRLKLRLK